MPSYELRQIAKELEKGTLWPVYWLYGQERMKSRNVLKQIRQVVLGDQRESVSSLGFAEETIDGVESSVVQVLDAAQSLSLGGGTRLVVVRDAHVLSDLDELSALFGPPGPKDQHSSVCVFLSKDLDGRKKFSKALLEKAAVVPCEEVPEDERENSILQLAKQRGLTLSSNAVLELRALDPWNLDIVERELEKRELTVPSSTSDSSEVNDSPVFVGSSSEFIEAFFGRNRLEALKQITPICENPDEAIPLLGLLAWNVRHLALSARGLKLGSFMADRFSRWNKRWKLSEILELQQVLAELDFSTKQTPRLPVGLWTSLVLRFCR